MPHKYARYGLERNLFEREKANPYAPRDPVRPLVRITGFSDLEKMEALVEQAVVTEQPAFFLISGESGTGRSYLAHYLIDLYRTRRGIARDQFVVPNPGEPNDSAFDTTKRWINTMYSDMFDREWLSAAQEQQLKEILSSSGRDDYQQPYRRGLSRIARELDAAQTRRGFAACLEKIKSSDTVRDGLTVFKNVRTICVFTQPGIDAEIVDAFRAHGQAFTDQLMYDVKLSDLSGTEAKMLIHDLWESARPGVECPFDSEGIEGAFRDKRFPTGRVLSRMSDIFGIWTSLLREGEAWPAAREDLFFSQEKLREII